MSKVLIEESTLTALGDALRSKEIVPSLRDTEIDFLFKTPNATSYTDPTPTERISSEYEEIITIPEAVSLKVVLNEFISTKILLSNFFFFAILLAFLY